MARIADIAPIPLALVETDPDEAARRFGDSFQRTGFALVEGHGIPQPLVDAAQAAIRRVFALPLAEKARSHVPDGAGQRGYTGQGVETARGQTVPDRKEFWHVGRELPPGHPHAAIMAANVWPEAVPEFRPLMLELFSALEAVGLRVLSAIARHLGRDPAWFEDAVRDGNSILRLLHYPPVPPGASGIRAAAHEDINVITLLLGAEEAGLELLERDGRWSVVPAPPGSLVVNVGDMLQRQTGGLLPSTTHRVVNPAPDRAGLSRYSMPFFLHFRPDWRIEPMVANPAMPPITAHEFLAERLREIGLA